MMSEMSSGFTAAERDALFRGTAMTANVITYCGRSAMREAGIP